MIPNSDFATLKIIINATKIFDETREVCHLSDAIKELMEKRTKGISAPNKKVLNVVISSIKNMCQDHKSSLEQIKASFGISPSVGSIKQRHKRQFVLASVLITSLITYFSTKELIAMSSGDSDDELYNSTNHIISAIEDHETRIVRLEDHQKQLEHHIKELTGTLIMGIEQSDIFSWISLLDPTLVIPMAPQVPAQAVGRFCSLGEPDHILQVRYP